MSNAKFALAALLMVAAAQASAETRIVALGASNVEGWRIQRGAAFPAQLEAMLRKRGYDVRVVNAGVSWDTSRKMLDRLASAVPNETAIVILAENVRQVTNEFMPVIEERLRQRGISVLRVNFRGMPYNLLQRDGIHMTEEGHAHFASRLLPRIIPLIQRHRGH